MPVDALCDDIDACSVVILVTDKQCQHDHDTSAGENPYIGILEKMFIKRFGLVQHHAEQDTDTGAENCQHGDADGVADSEGGNRINEKKFLRNSERNGNPHAQQGKRLSHGTSAA